MIVLLGATGYVGSEFARQFNEQHIPYVSLSRNRCDYYQPALLAAELKKNRASFLINCAGYTGKPNVDACELHRTECLLANAVLPGLIAEACGQVGIPWGHVSSGCIFTGQKPDGSGFTELDPPNFSFRQDNCSFYSGCKALGEECLDGVSDCYIWRLRIPFDHRDSPRNYLSKVLRYPRLLDARNSLSHLGQFAEACYQCWDRRLDFGIYNLTNTGSVTTRQVAELLRGSGVTDKEFDFFESEAEFMRLAATTPRSNTVLDNSKALQAGLPLTSAVAAIEASLRDWQPAPSASLT